MKCHYRNCHNEVEGGRSDKIYCQETCRRNEKKYRQRERDKKRKIEKTNI